MVEPTSIYVDSQFNSIIVHCMHVCTGIQRIALPLHRIAYFHIARHVIATKLHCTKPIIHCFIHQAFWPSYAETWALHQRDMSSVCSSQFHDLHDWLWHEPWKMWIYRGRVKTPLHEIYDVFTAWRGLWEEDLLDGWLLCPPCHHCYQLLHDLENLAEVVSIPQN